MPASHNRLGHEAASLFRLVDSIDVFIAEHEGLYAYTEPSEAFFRWITTEASATKKAVTKIVNKSFLATGSVETPYHRELIIQKSWCRTIHTYIKPAADAHTLSLPLALIELATEHLRYVPGMNGKKIVVLHTPELMYYHNAPQVDFPGQFIFIEIPYSQVQSFFTNLTIYHELGHCAYDSLGEPQTIRETLLEYCRTQWRRNSLDI